MNALAAESEVTQHHNTQAQLIHFSATTTVPELPAEPAPTATSSKWKSNTVNADEVEITNKAAGK